MTIFGCIWLVLIVYCISKKDIKYITFLTLFSMIFQSTNVISFNGLSIGPQVITNIVFIFVYILKNHSSFVKKPSLLEVTIYLTFIIIIISSVLAGTLLTNGLRILQLFIYMISFSLMIKLNKTIDEKFIYKTIKIITIFVLVMGIIQIITTSGILPRIKIINTLFYNDTSSTVLYWKINYKRLCSVFMEPSYCGCFLVGALYYFISIYRKDKKNLILIIFLILEIILTRSSTAYAALVICGVIFLFVSNNRYIKKIIIPVALTMVILLFVFFPEILDSVIFSKSSSASAITRYYWNLKSIRGFEESFLLGVGYNNVRGSSLAYSLLGEIGIIGFLFYTLINLQIIIPLFKNKTYKFISSSALRFSILSIVISQLIAVPDFDFCVYWLFMYLFGLSGISNKIKKENMNYENI